MRSDYGEDIAYKVIVVGDSSVGKTSILNTYIYGKFSE